MDFLGLGPLEILTILIVGFLIFGPEKLPGIAAKAGKWYRKLTGTTSNIARTINEEVSKESRQDTGTPAKNDNDSKGADTGKTVLPPGEKKVE